MFLLKYFNNHYWARSFKLTTMADDVDDDDDDGDDEDGPP